MIIKTFQLKRGHQIIDISFDQFESHEPLYSWFEIQAVKVDIDLTEFPNQKVRDWICKSFEEALLTSFKDVYKSESQGKYLFECNSEEDLQFLHDLENILFAKIRCLEKIDINYKVKGFIRCCDY